MLIEGISNILNDAQTDIIGEVALAKIHEAAKGKDPYDNEGEIK